MALVQKSTTSAQVSESQQSSLQLEVTVLRAQNLPLLKTLVGKERRYYVNVTYGARIWQTRSMRSTGQSVEWNENIGAFAVQPLSSITASLYAKYALHKDILIGRKEIHCEPQHEIDVILSSVDGHSRNPTESATVLTITLSANSQTEVSDTALHRAEEAIDMMETWSSAVDVIKQVMDAVSPIAALQPYANLAWSLLSKIPETLLQQVQRDNNVRTLFQAIRDAFEFAKDADALRNINPKSRQAKILEEMLQCVYDIGKFIELYASQIHVGMRTWTNISGGVDGEIDRYRSMLVRLRDEFLARAAVTTEITVLGIQDDLRHTELGIIIRELPYKGGWRLGDKSRCLPGTREDFLDHIVKWVENPESERGLVLLGQAGTGKSSIAHEIARRFENKCLGSYFTFLRKEQSKDEAYQIFTTLARDLSDRNPAFKVALGKVVKDNSSLCGTRDYSTLFERLLLEPLKNVEVRHPILIVIDALDESGDAIGKTGLHTFLAQHLFEFPSKFRILVTSRPEDGIEAAFSKASSVDTLYMDDAKLASRTEEDIRTYFQKMLDPDVFEAHGVDLAKAAEGLFQWAAVSGGFINSRASLGLTMKKRVQRLLGHSRGRNGEGLLDNLYEEVLKEYFNGDEAQALFRSIMGQLFAAIEPISLESLIVLQRHAPIDDTEDSDPRPVLEILEHLGSLLSNVTSSDQTRPIIPLHTSFRDFLTDKKSGAFYVDLDHAHHQLAHSCLGLMLNNLKFNICKLESSYIPNSDVLDLESRIAQYIPPALSYACVSWEDHLKHAAFDDDLVTQLRSLFETKFLFWLEVLSIKGRVGLASQALSSLKTWLRSGQRKSQRPSDMEVENLLASVNDASSFVRCFGKAIARSAPHIYVSALPFVPESSQILKNYIHLFTHTLSLERGQLPHWPALEMMIHHIDDVNFVAFSPDGLRIASASRDHKIRMWDSTTEELVAGPFIGHTDTVFSVVFSPDGQRIASASGDLTIRVWDATTGEVVAGPFTGHTDEVNSVAFSPDGQHIASGSSDLTVRVWDAATGEVVAAPFTGHSAMVSSVTFSPDGERIVSASADRTICVWDALTGEVVAGPFTGHTDFVTSIASSPDGQHIASASQDRTVRVWDATTGEVVAGPFVGHTDSVNCVAFSPDGQRIASASTDLTIRMWDAVKGEEVAGPFAGHTNVVCSVAFSPDGQRIASASYDCTICVWDAATEEFVAGTFTGHTNSVTCVVFSPDGQHIASASEDHKICVWDAATGDVVVGPFTGHTDGVMSIAFSLDGQRIASGSGDHTIRVWDAATGEVVAGPFAGHSSWVRSVVFSPDGQRIASASTDRTIRVWNSATGRVVAGPFTAHTNEVNSVAFSPDGQCIASASLDLIIRVWNATTGEVVAGPFTGHTGWVFSVAFSPDGRRIASASVDFTIRVWDAATGEIVAGPFIGHTDRVYCVAFSPDGQRIASASADLTLRVWDAAKGQVVAGPFTGHTEQVNFVAFSPDGQRIASASDDFTIRLWDATTREPVTPLSTRHPKSSFPVTSSPGRQHIASGSASRDRTIRVKGRREGVEKFYFIDELVIDDGWMYGEEGELLLWIPLVHRPYLRRPNTIWIAGKHYTELDISNFVHGSDWATVYVHSSSN